MSEASGREYKTEGLMIRYGTQVNKALTSAMILWAICMSSIQLLVPLIAITPRFPNYHSQPSLPSFPSLGIQLINSNNLPILHCHLHPSFTVRTSIKGIEVYRKFPILSILLCESFHSSSSFPFHPILLPISFTLHRPSKRTLFPPNPVHPNGLSLRSS